VSSECSRKTLRISYDSHVNSIIIVVIINVAIVIDYRHEYTNF